MFITKETSRVEITVYPNHPSEFGVRDRSVLAFRNAPTKERSDEHVIGVSTTKRMGEVAGRFEVQIKSPRDLRRYVQDGDWIDIVFTRHENKYHIMRGVVMTIIQSVTASSGATESTYTLVGEEFSYIFGTQGFWFDQVTQGDFFPFISSRVWSRNSSFFNGTPSETVAILLHSFLLPANNAGAALWQVPNSMPAAVQSRRPQDDSANTSPKRMFKDVYAFVDGYSEVPPRTSAIIPDRFSSNAGTVWELALEFADTMLCELYTELIVDLFQGRTSATDTAIRGSIYIDGPSTPPQTRMAVIHRDLPFPNTVRDGKTATELLTAPYFSLPLVSIKPQQVASTSLSVHGELRKNMIFFGPSLFQELIGNYLDMQLPLIDLESVKNHGIRRLDAVSRYYTDPRYVDAQATKSGGVQSSQEQRNVVYRQMAYDYRDIVRDLHCMNHLYENGGIEVAHSLPEARIGTRIRIEGRSVEENFTAYIEGVSHTWSYKTGSRTSLTVSHGWRGSDQGYVEMLLNRIAAFEVYQPKFVEPTVEPNPPKTTDELLYTPAPGDRNYVESATAASTNIPPTPSPNQGEAELAELREKLKTAPPIEPEGLSDEQLIRVYIERNRIGPNREILVQDRPNPLSRRPLTPQEEERLKKLIDDLFTLSIDKPAARKEMPKKPRVILPASNLQNKFGSGGN